MTSLFRAAPLVLALTATPALAQPADQHADHHPAGSPPAAAAKPEAKPVSAQGCPPMNGQLGQAVGERTTGADGKPASGQMAMGAGGMMSPDLMQRCMVMMGQAKAGDTAPKAAPPEHDHQHQ